jgi:hypothetical protein
MHLPYDERPLKLTFGDDTEMTREEKELFVDIYDRFGIPVPWNVGDIAIVCNYRFAHGRPGIRLGDGEERELGVLIGEPTSAWATCRTSGKRTVSLPIHRRAPTA